MLITRIGTFFCWGKGDGRWLYLGGEEGVGWYWRGGGGLLWVDKSFQFLEISFNYDKFKEQQIYSYFGERWGGCKVTFKRKGSWLHFRRGWPRAIILKFGHGHYIRVWHADGFYCRRKKYLQRHSLLVGGGRWSQLVRVGKVIRTYRFFGRYTKRGVRLAREFFYRQQGKESQYTHLKSKIY